MGGGMRPLTKNDKDGLKKTREMAEKAYGHLVQAENFVKNALLLWERTSDYTDYLYDHFTIGDPYFLEKIQHLKKFLDTSIQELKRKGY
ncbi:MAG: hypothetical protein IJG38_01875 [Thermoguttaceae bacterium]|nr:hypothetical protein [Thermoguttaceae bacterium]